MKKKNRNKSRTRTIRARLFAKCDFIVIGICTTCICAGGIGLYAGSLDYQRAEKSYEYLGQYVQLIDETTTVGNGDGSSQAVSMDGKAIVSDQLYNINWTKLREINPDLIAWIIIPGTDVNYPIVQTTDNAKYLKTSFDGSKNACGTIFMNTYNRADFSDMNTILYGHNMRNGSMFAVVNKYKNESFMKEHDEIWVLTPFWERKYKVVSAHEAVDGKETYTIEFGPNGYEQFISDQVTRSLYETGNGYDVNMPVITLSTCTGRGELSRMVLVCQPVYETPLNPFIENKITSATVSGNGAVNQ